MLGFLLPDDEFASLLDHDPGMPTARQAFATGVVTALRSAGIELSLISSVPSASFPHNDQIVFRSHAMDDDGILVGFLNIPVLKQLTRAWRIFRVGPAQLRRTRAEALLVYGEHTPWLAFGVYASRRLNLPTVALLTDPPGIPHAFDSRFTRPLKRLDSAMVRLLLKSLDGVIALTRPLGDEFAPGVPLLVMEGIAQPARAQPRPHPRTAGELPVVAYAGGVNREYGVDLLVAAHQRTPGKYVLRIAGRGELAAELADLAATAPNLEYVGVLDPSAMGAFYASADVLVNARPPGQAFTPYSFPSKILEYMASGTPVVSTRLEGIPDEYWEYITAGEATPEGISEAVLGRIHGSAVPELGSSAAEFVQTHKSPAVRGREMARFLRQVCTP